LKNKRACSSVG